MKQNKKKQTRNVYIEYIGWIGVALLLISYILLSAGIILGESYAYQLMVLAGSASIAYTAWRKSDIQPAVLNMIFMFVALAAISRLFIIS